MDFYGLTLILRWVLGWLMRPIPRALPTAPDSHLGLEGEASVAVIVPARNEEVNIASVLAGLSRQTHPCQVVVVDDSSTDRTAELVLAAGVDLLQAPPLPEGWTGKSWACWFGASQTNSEILIFLDADTVPAPNLVGSLVVALAARTGLVSVQPYHLMKDWSERLAAFFNLLGAMGARLGRSHALAFGPVLATKREDYERLGGHQAIKGAVVEDVALGKLYNKNHLPVNSYAGRFEVAFRMYPSGVGQMFEGFVKNLAAGLAGTNFVWALGVIFWFSGVMVASWELPYALVKWLVTAEPPPTERLTWALFLYLLFALQVWLLLKPLGNFGWSALFMPIGVIVFIGVFGWSVIRAIGGEVRWKGRTLSTRGRH